MNAHYSKKVEHMFGSTLNFYKIVAPGISHSKASRREISCVHAYQNIKLACMFSRLKTVSNIKLHFVA